MLPNSVKRACAGGAFRDRELIIDHNRDHQAFGVPGPCPQGWPGSSSQALRATDPA
jgi:hypothetical protein